MTFLSIWGNTRAICLLWRDKLSDGLKVLEPITRTKAPLMGQISRAPSGPRSIGFLRPALRFVANFTTKFLHHRKWSHGFIDRLFNLRYGPGCLVQRTLRKLGESWFDFSHSIHGQIAIPEQVITTVCSYAQTHLVHSTQSLLYRGRHRS